MSFTSFVARHTRSIIVTSLSAVLLMLVLVVTQSSRAPVAQLGGDFARVANGELCTGAFECRSEYCSTSWRCEAAPSDVNRTFCRANGQACAANAQCCSNYCIGGSCTTAPSSASTSSSAQSSSALCRSIGQFCTSTNQCCTNQCANSACACVPIGTLCPANPNDCCTKYCKSNYFGNYCDCKAEGLACTNSTECCSGNCSGGSCSYTCRANTSTCTLNSECCSNLCSSGSCVAAASSSAAPTSSPPPVSSSSHSSSSSAPPSCRSDGQSCTNSTACCSGNCFAGICQSCRGNTSTCTLNSECCSNICFSGSCVSCKANASTCTLNIECCSGLCLGNSCTAVGSSSAAPASSSNPSCRNDGGACNNPSECCSNKCFNGFCGCRASGLVCPGGNAAWCCTQYCGNDGFCKCKPKNAVCNSSKPEQCCSGYCSVDNTCQPSAASLTEPALAPAPTGGTTGAAPGMSDTNICLRGGASCGGPYVVGYYPCCAPMECRLVPGTARMYTCQSPAAQAVPTGLAPDATETSAPALPSYCRTPTQCHCVCTGGRPGWLLGPGSQICPVTCGSPTPSPSLAPAIEAPEAPSIVPSAVSPESPAYRCPYDVEVGCHLECIGDEWRVRANSGEDPDGVMPGDTCDSPDTEARPSLFSKFFSGMMRLFYRPQAE